MIHVVKIDDSTTSGAKALKELKRYRKGVEIQNPVVSGIMPEGYMSSDDFYKAGRNVVTKLLKERGSI